MIKPLSIAITGAVLCACGGEQTSEPVDYDALKTAPQTEQGLVLATEDELLQQINNGIRLQLKQGNRYLWDSDAVVAEPSAGGAPTAPTNSNSGEFSQTNVHVNGVDEADYSKYDGQYWYIATEPNYEPFNVSVKKPGIKIIATDAQTPTAEFVSQFKFDDDWGNIGNLYLVQELAKTSHVASVRNQWGNVWPMLPGFPIDILAVDGGATVSGEGTATSGSVPPTATNNGTMDSSIDSAPVQAQLLASDFGVPIGPQNSKVRIDLVDTEDPTAPKNDWTLEIDGSLINSRKVGNTLYLVTRFDPWIRGLIYEDGNQTLRSENENLLADVNIGQLMPHYRIGSQETQLSNNCFIQADTQDVYGLSSLIHITAVDLAAQKVVSSQCINSNVENLSMSTESLYVTGTVWNASTGSSNTVIHKFDLDPSGPQYSATGSVEGSLNWRSDPAFRLHEYQDQLRVVTTENTNGFPQHHLTILQQQGGALETVSTLPNKAHPEPIGKPREDIYSVRFQDDRAYIVTFQRTDPLYAIDLSNPSDPVIAGELQIPGFATYMHPIGDDYLFTFGQEADENGRALGLKAELLNVANNRPEVVSSLTFGGRRSSSVALSDLHAISFLPLGSDSMRIALPMSIYNLSAGSTTWSYTGTQLLEVNGLDSSAIMTDAGVVVVDDDQKSPTYRGYNRSRTLLHDDAVFVNYGNEIWAANWFNPKAVAGPLAHELITCTADFRMGLVVTLDLTGDAVTQNACDAEVVAYSDRSSETLQAQEGSGNQCVFVGAGEQAGNFAIEASLPGYQPGFAKTTVYQDDCHVIPEMVNITLKEQNPTFCTLEARPSISLDIYGSDSSSDVCDARVYVEQRGEIYPLDSFAQSGSSSGISATDPAEDVAIDFAPIPAPMCNFQGPYELGGEMTLHIEHPNYADYEQVIRIDQDECHVKTQSLSVGLKPLPL